jgi:Predicted AAA-ATPase
MFIEELDKRPRYQYMFLRPRRWGKSTLLQMLARYYDKSKAGEFEEFFGQLYIGKNPTPYRSTLLVLLFDLSAIHTLGPGQMMEKDFNRTINMTLKSFLVENGRLLGYPDVGTLIGDDSTASLQSVLVSTVLPC